MGKSPIRAELQVPRRVVVPLNRKTVKIEVAVVLHNDSDEHYVVGAPHTGAIRSSMVMDDASREIARSTSRRTAVSKGATHPYCSVLVPSNHSLREQDTVTVDASKLADGRRYVVRYSNWGHVGEAEFVAMREPERAPAAKKAPKRKPRRRQTGGRKKTGGK